MSGAPELRFAVIGDPIGHSLSPRMHRAAFEASRLPHVYEALRVPPADLGATVDALRDGRYSGLNVTVPHKRRVLDYVDVVAPSAARVGAANTLVRTAEGVVAHNTDVLAIADEVRALAGERRDWTGASALVFGTGGAARAALAALSFELSVRSIEVRGRTPDALGDWVASSGRGALREAGKPQVEARFAPLAPQTTDGTFDILVQATSAGMSGAARGEPIADALVWADVPSHAVALEMIYAPPETPWLLAARARGLRATSGFGMLARQGARAFELWFERPAPFQAMFDAIAPRK